MRSKNITNIKIPYHNVEVRAPITPITVDVALRVYNFIRLLDENRMLLAFTIKVWSLLINLIAKKRIKFGLNTNHSYFILALIKLRTIFFNLVSLMRYLSLLAIHLSVICTNSVSSKS